MGKDFKVFALVFGLVAIATGGRSASAQEVEALVFEPSGAWVMDYGEEACALNRTFAVRDTSLIAQLKSNSLGNFIEISLASSDLETDQGRVTYQFLPDEEPREPPNPRVGSFTNELEGVSFIGSMIASTGDVQPRATSWPARERQQREAAITGLQVTGVFEQQVLIRTGPMDAVMDAMRACLVDLYVSWGFDPSTADVVAVPATRLNLNDIARRVMQAYPRELGRSGISALVNVVVSVGRDGRITNCHAHNPQPHPQFETAACETLLQYARYEPARDADGNSVESFDSLTLVFSPT